MCVSVTQHLTSRTFACLTIGTTYSTGSEGQTFCVVFSENAPLQSWSGSIIVRLCASQLFLLCDMYAPAHNDRCTGAVLFTRGVIFVR